MVFMIVGLLRRNAEADLIRVRNEINEHLSQPFRSITAAGVMRDRAGDRRGYTVFFEAESIEDAERFLHEGPLYREGVYDRVEIFQYDVEVGTIA